MLCCFMFFVYVFLLHLRTHVFMATCSGGRCTQKSLCAVPGQNMAAECSRAQPSGVYFIGCLFRSVKHATQGPCEVMY